MIAYMDNTERARGTKHLEQNVQLRRTVPKYYDCARLHKYRGIPVCGPRPPESFSCLCEWHALEVKQLDLQERKNEDGFI